MLRLLRAPPLLRQTRLELAHLRGVESVSQPVITTLLPTGSTWSTYTRSVLYECVAESQSQGGLGGVGICQPTRGGVGAGIRVAVWGRAGLELWLGLKYLPCQKYLLRSCQAKSVRRCAAVCRVCRCVCRGEQG